MLLRDGFARCVDWSIGVVSQGVEKYRAAEKSAKDKRLRIWKDWSPTAATASMGSVTEKEYAGKVCCSSYVWVWLFETKHSSNCNFYIQSNSGRVVRWV